MNKDIDIERLLGGQSMNEVFFHAVVEFLINYSRYERQEPITKFLEVWKCDGCQGKHATMVLVVNSLEWIKKLDGMISQFYDEADKENIKRLLEGVLEDEVRDRTEEEKGEHRVFDAKGKETIN